MQSVWEIKVCKCGKRFEETPRGSLCVEDTWFLVVCWQCVCGQVHFFSVPKSQEAA